MAYKASYHNAPPYLCDMLNWYQPARTRRSDSTTSLVPNRNRTIKKPGLDRKMLKNYRPVSNLSFYSYFGTYFR